jgi:hypothetical protein
MEPNDKYCKTFSLGGRIQGKAAGNLTTGRREEHTTRCVWRGGSTLLGKVQRVARWKDRCLERKKMLKCTSGV